MSNWVYEFVPDLIRHTHRPEADAMINRRFIGIRVKHTPHFLVSHQDCIFLFIYIILCNSISSKALGVVLCAIYTRDVHMK